MEIVLNFEEKELAVNDSCNFVDLHRKVKKLLGDDLPNWTIAGKEVKWLWQYFPTIIYTEPKKLIWYDYDSTGRITYGDQQLYESIVCFSDNPEHGEVV